MKLGGVPRPRGAGARPASGMERRDSKVHSKLVSVDEKRPGQYLMKSEVTMEVEGGDKPALIAETLGLIYV